MESIHPNDIMTLDMTKVSYVTLKDGSMIVIDDSIPEKGNKDKKDIPAVSNKNKLPKEIKLEISSPSTLLFKGNSDKNKYKSNFKICTQIIKNTNFSFFGKKFESKSSFKSNSDSHSNSESNKENKDLNNKNNISSTTLKSILKIITILLIIIMKIIYLKVHKMNQIIIMKMILISLKQKNQT